jgi:hypothetical protein
MSSLPDWREPYIFFLLSLIDIFVWKEINKCTLTKYSDYFLFCYLPVIFIDIYKHGHLRRASIDKEWITVETYTSAHNGDVIVCISNRLHHLFNQQWHGNIVRVYICWLIGVWRELQQYSSYIVSLTIYNTSTFFSCSSKIM